MDRSGYKIHEFCECLIEFGRVCENVGKDRLKSTKAGQCLSFSFFLSCRSAARRWPGRRQRSKSEKTTKRKRNEPQSLLRFFVLENIRKQQEVCISCGFVGALAGRFLRLGEHDINPRVFRAGRIGGVETG